MSKVTEQIADLLKDDALQHSLAKETLSAMLKEIDTLSERNEFLQDQITTKEDRIEKLDGELAKTKAELQTALDCNQTYMDAETELKEREKKVLRLEIENEFAEKRIDDLKGIMTNLTRNTEYRRSFYSKQPVAVAPPTLDQFGNPQYGHVETHSAAHSVTEEEK